uniref:Uncharacterized protein n=1 Tax=Denticeps clupeoides TaxID=299321 RepID=A0AAY4DSQ4_9TELE
MTDLLFNTSSFLFTQEVPPANFTLSTLPSTMIPATPHNPLTTIIIAFCILMLLGAVAAFLILCRGADPFDSDCAPAELFPCGETLSSEPQLKLWKRLGSVRQHHRRHPTSPWLRLCGLHSVVYTSVVYT